MRLSIARGKRNAVQGAMWLVVFSATIVTGDGGKTAVGVTNESKPEPAVKDIRRLNRGLNTGFELIVENLPPSNDDRTKWLLYFDGLPIKNLTPSLPAQTALPSVTSLDHHLPDITFQFEFSHNRADQTWRDLFARAGFYRESSLTIGSPTGDIIVKPQLVPFKRLMIPVDRLVVASIFYLAVLGIVMVLARRSNLLKENSGHNTRVFSLGRAQMAFWFFIVLGAYLFIGVLTGTWIGTIGTQALALMGISATTGIAAAIVGNEKRQQMSSAPAQTANLISLQGTLQAAIKDPVNVNNMPVLIEQLKTVGNQIAQSTAAQAVSPSASLKGNGFWRDIASDTECITLPRFQVIVWTVVLGAVFLMRVLTDLVMPELDPTTLALMGISSGTYLGFKFPEKA